MDKGIKEISKQLDNKLSVLLPNKTDADCYAVYSKEEFTNADNRLLIEGKAYKHRLYLYKKTGNKSSDKILSFIFLNPGISNHINQDKAIENCILLAKDNYCAIEIFSIFTLRTIDTIDAVTEDAILNATRTDLSKNDIVLAYGDEITETDKYKNISKDDLEKINKVRQFKINELLNFLSKEKNNGKIYTIGLTQNNNPMSMDCYQSQDLIEFKPQQ